MDIKALDRDRQGADGKIIAEGFSDGKIVIKTIKAPGKRAFRIKLETDAANSLPEADGSSVIPIIATMLDEKGDVKRLSNEFIRFKIEGEGVIVEDESTMANPRKIEWGTAPLLIRTTLKPGKIKVIAEPAFRGTQKPKPDTLELNTIKRTEAALFNPADALIKSSTLTPAFKGNSIRLTDEEKRKALRQTEKDQEIFEGKAKEN